MSEKRFKYGRVFPINSDDSLPCITDSENDKDYFRMSDIVNVLNEQQNFIYQLQDLCGESDSENAKLRLKNKELQEEIKLIKPVNLEQYEQIVQLQEENEQLREINKKLGDDLHNCRINKNIISEKLRLWQDVHKKYGIYNIKDFEELMKKVK